MPESTVVVVGAGPAGLAFGLSYARRGHRVTLLERDAPPPLDDAAGAFDTWARPGVPHHRLPHSLLGRTRRALRENAPDVLETMLHEGAWENDLATRLLGDAAEAHDADLVAVHCRRPFFECVLRRAAEAEPLLTIESGVKVLGITVRAHGASRATVTGVRTDGGSVEADMVIDSSGRRSVIRRSLQESGLAVPEAQVEPCGVVYYCRYFQLRPGVDLPDWRGVLGPGGTTDCTRFSIFFGDNRTYSVVLGVLSSVREFRALAREKTYMEAASRFHPLTPFVDAATAEPITGVVAMGALQNVFHPPLLDDGPPVLGLHFLGDAYCHTNPLFAWGLCLALDYGFRLAGIVSEHPTDLEAQALAFADATQVEAGQCFRAVADEDRDRTLTWQGEQPSGSWLGRTFAGFVRQCAQPAVMLDPQVARAVLRRSQLLDRPDDLMKRDGVIQRIVALQPQLQAPPPGSFPSRPELLELMAQALPS